jgi:hypothetical protein
MEKERVVRIDLEGCGSGELRIKFGVPPMELYEAVVGEIKTGQMTQDGAAVGVERTNATPNAFAARKFAIGEAVAIAISGEKGVVTGRAEYAEAAPQCYLVYKNAKGEAVEKWWDESKLLSADGSQVRPGDKPWA